jgi:hypothetical protein
LLGITECLRGTRRVDGYRSIEAERNLGLGIDHGRASASQKDTQDSSRCASAGTDRRASPKINTSADRCAKSGCSGYCADIAAHRSGAALIHHLRTNLHRRAIDQCQVGEFDTELRSAFDTTRLFSLRDASANRLAALRDYDTVHYQRLREGCGEGITLMILIR